MVAVLIWVNGPFGGGKTQVAHELHRRIPGSVICDPELVGFGLQRMTPPPLRGDFQDLPAWRQGVHEVLHHALTTFPGHVVVPMTLVDPTYFEEIVGRLRADGHPVHHVALLADRRVVLRRLRQRAVGASLERLMKPGWTPRREAFAVGRLDRCLEQLEAPLFATHLRTDDLSVPQVAEQIAAAAGLDLRPDDYGRTRRRLVQRWTTLRHVRLD
jgi:hypothetical protein